MTRRGWAVAGLLLASCGQRADKAGAPDSAATPAAAAVPAAPASAPPYSLASGRQIGTVSSLSGVQSGLKGLVSDFEVRRTATATVVALAADTLFAFDKADLAPEAVANLRRTADLVTAGGAGAVTVTGYTDAKGEDAYNRALSQRRADAVAGWLRTQPALAGRQFTTVGKGEADPVAPNTLPDGADDPDGRARNRRVEVSIPR